MLACRHLYDRSIPLYPGLKAVRVREHTRSKPGTTSPGLSAVNYSRSAPNTPLRPSRSNFPAMPSCSAP